ncbi:glycoside hydrolase family 43 protein [Desertivirga xinjiangensis]|uniref:glycoside hydrolase family 43 protein n=1 Tax=Desertivirga xinjiangensis TaxID=539206 RepID=UPI002109E952|nr:glycoside hydrolase family 43 protein [Pedobacter xinjiangensis]
MPEKDWKRINMSRPLIRIALPVILLSATGCFSQDAKSTAEMKSKDTSSVTKITTASDTLLVQSKPLISSIYTADPSAHVFDGKIYIYPSHDIESGIAETDNGDHFNMKDYHILSMDEIGGSVKDHGVALDVSSIPWAGKQLWAPDAAYKNGKYYLYFPVKDKEGVFRIGVATSNKPQGPFKPQPKPMEGSYSIDPAVFTDDDGISYMYFGGIWGGQLQKWERGKFNPGGSKTDLMQDDKPALTAKIAKLKDNMLEFAEAPRDVVILDEDGNVIKGGDHDKRFFEAAWLHKYQDKYYFSYSTGDTHKIVYATGTSPYGPFTYQGVVLKPVLGWTNHHSIVEFKGKWYLFYHDCELSKGQTHLRNVKVTELHYDKDGRIIPMDANVQNIANQ